MKYVFTLMKMVLQQLDATQRRNGFVGKKSALNQFPTVDLTSRSKMVLIFINFSPFLLLKFQHFTALIL